MQCTPAYWVRLAVVIVCVVGARSILAGEGALKTNAALFAEPTVFAVNIELSADDLVSQRREPRRTVLSRVLVDGREYAGVGIHLKGGDGSFRPVDEKPALTLTFRKGAPGGRFFGLRQIHLNNSVQDPTYLCEDLSGELFRRAGLPAARTAWASVQLNGRKLGLYVLKEGFSEDFLRLHFHDAKGNLYDGGLHHEIDEPLKLESGRGPRDHSDLAALAAAAQESDPGLRWKRLEGLLDVDRFLSFMAMEILAGHIDGYSLGETGLGGGRTPPPRAPPPP